MSLLSRVLLQPRQCLQLHLCPDQPVLTRFCCSIYTHRVCFKEVLNRLIRNKRGSRTFTAESQGAAADGEPARLPLTSLCVRLFLLWYLWRPAGSFLTLALALALACINLILTGGSRVSRRSSCSTTTSKSHMNVWNLYAASLSGVQDPEQNHSNCFHQFSQAPPPNKTCSSVCESV